MQDYSKFKLKDDEQLFRLLNGKDNLAVFSCNKCFKLYTSDFDCRQDTEADTFAALLEHLDKKIICFEKIDFLCNKHRLRHYFPPPVSSCSMFIIACGIGTQTAAGLVAELSLNIPVYTACDSVNLSSDKSANSTHYTDSYQCHHGMALTETFCCACGQCVLGTTGGICPVSGCPKMLLNGACGGSKNGKCETDSSKDCVWDKINHYVSHQQSLLIRKHNKFSKADAINTAISVQNKRLESFYGGLYLKYHKDSTAFLTLQDFPIPAKVTIPLLQHSGISAEPIVSIGDRVTVGQKIGEAVGVMSSSVHASICGYVSEIAFRCHPNTTQDVQCITIESDGTDELHKSVRPIPYWEDLDILDIDAIIAEKGIVGMGGAGFPTPVKLKSPKPIDTILVNGCESEPYITADHRIMLERADDIILGLQIAMKSTGAKRGIIVISDNKSDAVLHLESKTSEHDDIFVMALWSKYPQGAERMLIARSIGRHLEYGQRPYEVGAIVINVSTARAIGDAFSRGMPLIERAVTVTGEYIKKPGNYMVRIGTLASDILKYCQQADGHLTTILGGPMMGKYLINTNIPIIKGSNGLISLNSPLTCSSDCIRCGRCVDVCPMELLPLHFPILADTQFNTQNKNTNHNYDIGNAFLTNMENVNALNCIECGACDYICPSGIKIRDAVRDLKKIYAD